MKKSKNKSNPLVELMNRKVEMQKAAKEANSFGKFKANKPRNENNSNVGPSWGGRKGN
ncbi:MAG: hypothetical protein ACK41T_03600 [Pseudobdellovibrio sp.]